MKIGERNMSVFNSLYLLILVTIGIVLGMAPFAGARTDPVTEKDEIRYLKSLSIEDLAYLEVTSVSKKAEKLSDAAAAVFVISDEDIRRSGVTTIAEALRMVPGIQVAHIDANKWAITARGFSGSFANKLLVMIDGRTVYSPSWSGVFWNVQDTMLEDIARIEVIRGPGASLWGANAVNGIINIITKKAKETQGGLISGGVGTEERGFASTRYGWRTSDTSHLRLYAKYYDRDHGAEADGQDGHDQWSALRSGFRFDWEMDTTDAFTLQGDVYSQRANATYEFTSLTPPSYQEVVRDESELGGGNILSRWEHTLANDSEFALQVYFDHTRAADELFDEVRNTFDIDFQHRGMLNEANEIIWGLGYRNSRDETKPLRNTVFDPLEKTLELYSLFIQDRITVVPDRFWLTIGSKFENHTYTDWEVQPTGRFLWKAREDHSVWGAVSRAVRTPSRAEREVQFELQTLPPGTPQNPGPFPVRVRVNGSEHVRSEEVVAYELGYRFPLTDRMLWDVAVFYNKYKDLGTSTTGAQSFVPGPPPYVVSPETLINGESADTRGIEIATNFIPIEWWKLDLAYTYLKMNKDPRLSQIAGTSPQNQFSARSAMDLPRDFELDLWLRYVDDLPALQIDDYLTLDARLAWKPTTDLEIALVGRNLADDQHLEFVDLFFPARSTEVERSVYTKVTWNF